jgi:hypothetical protein
LQVLDRAGAGECPGYSQWLATLQAFFSESLREELTTVAGRPGHAAPSSQLATLRQELLTRPCVRAYLAPRGIGLTAASGDERAQTQLRRRFMLLGQTLDGMRVWDIRRAIQAARAAGLGGAAPLELAAAGPMAVDTLYAALFEPELARLELWDLPASHLEGPDLLNVLRVLDVPQALTLAAERARVRLGGADTGTYKYTLTTCRNLGWPEVEIANRPRE